MFSNRYYFWKLGGAATLAVLLGLLSLSRSDRINPPLWRCVAEPQAWEGTTLWIPRARIVRAGPSEFEIAAGDPEVSIRVEGSAGGAVGDCIRLRATFVAAGPRLSHADTTPASGRPGPRRFMEAVSVIVLVGVLANFARHFQFRPRILAFRRRP